MSSNIFKTLAKRSASGVIENILEELFRDDIHLGLLLSAYGYIVYAVVYTVAGKTEVLDKFNDFYKRRLKPWVDSNDTWNEMYMTTYCGKCHIL